MSEARENVKRITSQLIGMYGNLLWGTEWLEARKVIRSARKAYIERKPWHGKTIGAYDKQLWGACLDLFRGDIDAFGFIDAFASSIEEQLTRAWNEGAREVGQEPGDMTDEDLAVMQSYIDSENEHVLDLAQAIEDAIAEKLTIEDFRSEFRARVDMWVNRYTDVVNAAKVYFGGKTRLIWVEGDTINKCDSCLALDGIVAYAEEWEQSGVKPQGQMLQCGGWHCGCSLQPTDKRRTPNALETIMEIATSGNI